MTQLLLDSNYLPLILKMFAHQDVDQLIAQQNDRKEYRYVFRIVFCRFELIFGIVSSISAVSIPTIHQKRMLL